MKVPALAAEGEDGGGERGQGDAGGGGARETEGTALESPAMDPRPIGVFDSGMGGLTVLHECLVTMPHEDFVYLGDAARLPYGPRPLPEVARFAHEIGALPRRRRA